MWGVNPLESPWIHMVSSCARFSSFSLSQDSYTRFTHMWGVNPFESLWIHVVSSLARFSSSSLSAAIASVVC
jgi:hypothetical protein